jgi:hypothetical protein
MENPTVTVLVEKIELFVNQNGEFNYSYFAKMPKYFFAKA